MKLFIWNRLEGITNRYHDEAGICCIAEDLDSAHWLIQKALDRYADECPYRTRIESVPDPDEEYEIMTDTPKLFIFPDAGCCQ